MSDTSTTNSLMSEDFPPERPDDAFTAFGIEMPENPTPAEVKKYKRQLEKAINFHEQKLANIKRYNDQYEYLYRNKAQAEATLSKLSATKKEHASQTNSEKDKEPHQKSKPIQRCFDVSKSVNMYPEINSWLAKPIQPYPSAFGNKIGVETPPIQTTRPGTNPYYKNCSFGIGDGSRPISMRGHFKDYSIEADKEIARILGTPYLNSKSKSSFDV